MGHFQEYLETDLTSWTIGPYHGALPGPMRLTLNLDGEMIVSGSAENGFTHRGLEKTFELHYWQSVIPYADHLDPEGAVFGELALCLAVEKLGNIVVPARAESIRIILAELNRISIHLAYVARVAKAVGADTTIHYVLRDRERVLDLFELLTGARFSINFLRYGGVAADVTEGFIERVLEVCELIRVRLKEYNDLFTFNYAFRKRSDGIARISQKQVQHYGITGPNARASGVAFDVRKAQPYSGYHRLDFGLPVIQGTESKSSGDAHDRFLIRLREISESLEILKQVAERIPPGEFSAGKLFRDFTLPQGEGYSRVESARGLLGCYAVSDGGSKPCRIQFRVPSSSMISLLPELVRGTRLEDLPVSLASLDISVSEVDR